MKMTPLWKLDNGDVFLYQVKGEELRGWRIIGWSTGTGEKRVLCEKQDARTVWVESVFTYLGRTKYQYLPIHLQVMV